MWELQVDMVPFCSEVPPCAAAHYEGIPEDPQCCVLLHCPSEGICLKPQAIKGIVSREWQDALDMYMQRLARPKCGFDIHSGEISTVATSEDPQTPKSLRIQGTSA